MFTSLKTMYVEIRVMLAIFLIAADALVGGMLYAGHTFKAEEVEEVETGLIFTKLTETLYSLTGDVAIGDCEKIVPLLPIEGTFTVILESPGGSLQDGACLASHFNIRNVVTVVRDTPVLDENGDYLYKPDYDEDGIVMCASSCSLMFLGGNVRYLIGDVAFGIHGPRSVNANSINPAALEASAYRTAAGLLMLLKQLGVESEEVRMLFIQIPSSTMLWVVPRYFQEMPDLMLIATHYVDFWGFTAENPYAGLGG